MSADRQLTPRVIAYLRDALLTIPVERRPGFEPAQIVYRQLARWARRTDEPGVWRITESIGQIEAATLLTRATIRRALDGLEQIGLSVTERRGGGRGAGARGTTRLIVLDPVDNRETGRGNRATFRPKLGAVERAELLTQLGAVEAETGRGSGETGRGQPRNTASSSASSSARVADPVDNFTVADAEPEIFYLPAEIYERIGHRLGPHVRPKGP